MPELGEVAHAASLLRRFLLNQTIKTVTAPDDEILYVKPLNANTFKSTLQGAKVTNVNRQGKYFWFEVDNKRTVLLHFGMTGWIHVKDVYTHFIAMENAGDKKQKQLIEEMETKPTGPVIEDRKSELWPPKFVKFGFLLENGRELLFTDPRRLGRCRLYDLPASEILGLEPLSKLGRDFSQDKWALEEFSAATLKRKVPAKAYLLDQTVFSGIGNWMADEILYQARVHPNQYCDTLGEDQLKAIYENVVEISRIAVETEGNTAAFPDTWMMLHRWGKRRNEPQVMPSGDEIAFETIGGRTSCFVPRLQVLPDTPVKRKVTTKSKPEPVKKTVSNTKTSTKKVKSEEIEVKEEIKPTRRTKRSSTETLASGSKKVKTPEVKVEEIELDQIQPKSTRRTSKVAPEQVEKSAPSTRSKRVNNSATAKTPTKRPNPPIVQEPETPSPRRSRRR